MRRSMIALALAFSVSAQVYKWTDRAGKVHYGDRSPVDAKASIGATNSGAIIRWWCSRTKYGIRALAFLITGDGDGE